MTKVYILTRGSYSDYSIVAVFSSLEKLNEFKLAIPDADYNDTEEYDINPDDAQMVNSGLALWLVQMRHNGDVVSVRPRSRSYSSTSCLVYGCRPEAMEFSMIEDVVWARDEQHAVKIVNEKRIVLIALGRWQNGTQG